MALWHKPLLLTHFAAVHDHRCDHFFTYAAAIELAQHMSVHTLSHSPPPPFTPSSLVKSSSQVFFSSWARHQALPGPRFPKGTFPLCNALGDAFPYTGAPALIAQRKRDAGIHPSKPAYTPPPPPVLPPPVPDKPRDPNLRKYNKTGKYSKKRINPWRHLDRLCNTLFTTLHTPAVRYELYYILQILSLHSYTHAS